jgi:hypothetical protein
MPDRIIYVDGLLGRTKIKNPVNVPDFNPLGFLG